MTLTEREEMLRQLFQAGVDAVGGQQATYRALSKHVLQDKIHLVALGKAADAMASGALSVIGDRLISGLVLTKHDHLTAAIKSDQRLECIESGHPMPDESSLRSGQRLYEFVASIPAAHQLIFLVSGGASALVEYLNEGLTLADLKRETDKLLAGGSPIGEMNVHRRTLSRIKGGKLARQVKCPVLQLLISDVPGDKVADIGSGLLIPDALHGMPENLPVWQLIDTHIIASSSIAQAAVADAAKLLKLEVCQSSGNLDGDLPQVCERLATILRNPETPKGVYIWGGEPTVVLPASPGRGGRNQHLSLALSSVLAGLSSCSALVCGTDGTDGPTVDAGGIVSEQTAAKARSIGLDIDAYLERADAGSCLEQLDALVTTGPTGTNVMDLAIAIVA